MFTILSPIQLIQTLQPKYPTKEQILKREIRFRKETIETVSIWKDMWLERENKSNKSQKIVMLAALLEMLAEIYEKPVKIGIDEEAKSPYYVPREKRIYLNKSLSIISTLHEFGHHLFGNSELKACRWSVWLFIKVFPKAYEKLEWQGHLLTKPKGQTT